MDGHRVLVVACNASDRDVSNASNVSGTAHAPGQNGVSLWRGSLGYERGTTRRHCGHGSGRHDVLAVVCGCRSIPHARLGVERVRQWVHFHIHRLGSGAGRYDNLRLGVLDHPRPWSLCCRCRGRERAAVCHRCQAVRVHALASHLRHVAGRDGGRGAAVDVDGSGPVNTVKRLHTGTRRHMAESHVTTGGGRRTDDAAGDGGTPQWECVTPTERHPAFNRGYNSQ